MYRENAKRKTTLAIRIRVIVKVYHTQVVVRLVWHSFFFFIDVRSSLINLHAISHLVPSPINAQFISFPLASILITDCAVALTSTDYPVNNLFLAMRILKRAVQ